MPKILYVALTPYTGRAIRFEKAEGETAFSIMEGAEKNAGDDPSRSRLMRETKAETIRVCLRGITSKPVPLIYVDKRVDAKGIPLPDGAPAVLGEDGKPLTVKVVDEDATLKAIEDDEDARAKGCAWRNVGHLDMITADSETHLYKLFPDAAELLEVAGIIERAGARPRLPLLGKMRTVAG